MGVNQPTHEERDLSFRAVLLFVISLMVMLVIVHFVAMRTFDYFAARRSPYSSPSPLANARAVYTGPRLLADQTLQMQKLRETEESRLNSYGWIDRDHGVVQIPIDRAMELIAQHGLPTNIVEEIPQP